MLCAGRASRLPSFKVVPAPLDTTYTGDLMIVAQITRLGVTDSIKV